MIVIDSHEFVVLLLIDLMRDRFSVDNCCHAEECIALCVLLLFTLIITNGLYLDVINGDFSAMLTFTEPSLAFIHFIKALSIDMGNGFVFWLLLY